MTAAVVADGPTSRGAGVGSGTDGEVVNPADGAVVARVPWSTPADVDDAVAAASTAFLEWSRATPGERSAASRGETPLTAPARVPTAPLR